MKRFSAFLTILLVTELASRGHVLPVTPMATQWEWTPLASSSAGEGAQMKMKLSWLSGLQRHWRRADVILQCPVQSCAVAAFQRVRRPRTPWPRQRLPSRRRIATDWHSTQANAPLISGRVHAVAAADEWQLGLASTTSYSAQYLHTSTNYAIRQRSAPENWTTSCQFNLAHKLNERKMFQMKIKRKWNSSGAM